jgi:hypothetical protein
MLKSSLIKDFQTFWSTKTKSIFTLSNYKSKEQNNKLRTYTLFKKDMRQETYLQLKDFKLRKHLSQFRLSAHKLEIERGRFHDNIYIPAELRICKHCHLERCEDEKHLILDCPLYSILRESLFKVCAARNNFFINYTDEQKFIWILSTEDTEIIKEVANYVYKGMNMRTDM